MTNTSSPPTDAAPATDAAPENVLRGARLIADQVTRLPNKPGVYRMLGEARPTKAGETREVLYVGKARDLKKRVSSYARTSGHSNRIMRMIAATRAMMFIVTETETEALLLEANLIKQLKPRYNVILRDDKSFPHILIATDHEAPQLIKHRGAHKRPGHYFGPFASAGAVNRTLNTLEKAFLLRSCSDSVYESRTRPCLLHQIKRCSAPCVGLIGKEEYDGLVADALAFLNGQNRDVQAALSVEMDAAAANLEFERAAAFRDRIRALSYIQGDQIINPGAVVDADVFAIHSEGGQSCVQVFFFRAGQNWGNHAFYPRHDRDETPADILDAFLAQFYDTREAPKLILLNTEVPNASLLAEALGLRAGRKISISAPQRGEKRELIEHAALNAREALGRRMAESASQLKLLSALGETFGLTAAPKRIEVYDNSHIQGTNAVGAMIVSGPDGLMKNQYRKFNIKDPETIAGDDYGMMREVFTRRFSRLLKEDHPGSPSWPDLIVIDGGKGQLSTAMAVMADLGVPVGLDTDGGEIALASLAKARREDGRGRKLADRTAGAVDEQFFLPGKPPFTLEARSPVLYYLQRLRDEAHRFAIGAHRSKRAKQAVSNPLDGVPGVGAARKRALLRHFGSAKEVARAKPSDLTAVEGISEALAQRIHDHFQGEGR